VTQAVSPPATLRAVLFDLDDTLFDHRHATHCALRQIQRFEPALSGWDIETLQREHSAILEELHVEVVYGRMTVDNARVERFRRLLSLGGVSDAVARPVAAARCYREAYERGWQPVAGAPALLRALKGAGIWVGVVTNNIVSEQRKKLDRCELGVCVDALVTSEEVGVQKPAAEIFQVALTQAQASPEEAVMIGDNWTNDVEGALAAGIRPIWLNRTGAPSPDPSVDELRSLLPTDAALRIVRPL
jgi:putative hydrolase of the HAD superfamily